MVNTKAGRSFTSEWRANGGSLSESISKASAPKCAAERSLWSSLMRSSVFNFHAARFRLRWACLCAFLACFIPNLCESATELNDRDLAGQFLVASEEMKDPRFFETVNYMVKHNSEGTLGLIINRPLAKGPVDDLLKGFGAAPKGSKREIVIHYGGPVSSRQG